MLKLLPRRKACANTALAEFQSSPHTPTSMALRRCIELARSLCCMPRGKPVLAQILPAVPNQAACGRTTWRPAYRSAILTFFETHQWDAFQGLALPPCARRSCLSVSGGAKLSFACEVPGVGCMARACKSLACIRPVVFRRVNLAQHLLSS